MIFVHHMEIRNSSIHARQTKDPEVCITLHSENVVLWLGLV